MSGRRSRFTAAAALVVACAIGSDAAEGPLFPTPLHIVRRVTDSITNAAVTVNEFCSGNRITSVFAEGGVPIRIVAIDYGAEEVLEIDRTANSFSVTSFAEVANGGPAALSAATAKAWEWEVKPQSDSVAAEGYRAVASAASGKVTVDVSVDRQRTFSREAIEALTGSSYPNRRSEVRMAIVNAAAPSRAVRAATLGQAGGGYGLPMAEKVTFEAAGDRVVSESSIVSVDAATVPLELLVIPPGARRVPSKLARFRTELELADRPPKRP